LIDKLPVLYLVAQSVVKTIVEVVMAFLTAYRKHHMYRMVLMSEEKILTVSVD
jgi:hypothetical protein